MKRGRRERPLSCCLAARPTGQGGPSPPAGIATSRAHPVKRTGKDAKSDVREVAGKVGGARKKAVKKAVTKGRKVARKPRKLLG